ncbi:MAG TPA: hypothetical protein VFR24_15045 [Candidatus Angelobacter sp.]|nr:hypothetical protein [Candidatus Angelobacter sp.]
MGFFCKCDLEHGATRTEQLPIQLNRGSSGFDPSFDPFYADEETRSAAEDQPYYDLLLDFPLTTGPEVVTADGYAYVMLQDSRFRVGMPKITKFPDHAGMMKVNQLLAKELAQYRLQAAGCAQGIDFNGGDFDLSTGVELFSRHLFSVVRHGSSFCGGAHPNFQSFINLYDLHTGTEVSTEDLLAREIDPDTVKKLIGNTSADGADLIRGLMAELYLQHAHPEADCLDVITRDENRAPVFSTKHYLSSHGLVLVPDLPHVEQACAEDVIIPYGELRPLLRKNSQLFMLAGINQ